VYLKEISFKILYLKGDIQDDKIILCFFGNLAF